MTYTSWRSTSGYGCFASLKRCGMSICYTSLYLIMRLPLHRDGILARLGRANWGTTDQIRYLGSARPVLPCFDAGVPSPLRNGYRRSLALPQCPMMESNSQTQHKIHLEPPFLSPGAHFDPRRIPYRRMTESERTALAISPDRVSSMWSWCAFAPRVFEQPDWATFRFEACRISGVSLSRFRCDNAVKPLSCSDSNGSSSSVSQFV